MRVIEITESNGNGDMYGGQPILIGKVFLKADLSDETVEKIVKNSRQNYLKAGPFIHKHQSFIVWLVRRNPKYFELLHEPVKIQNILVG